VKFTPQEMAYDPSPEETDDWLPIGRGIAAYEKYKQWKKQMIRLEPDVAKVFRDSQSVNKALRKLIEAMPETSGRKKKSA
jgi:hypothetical protein